MKKQFSRGLFAIAALLAASLACAVGGSSALLEDDFAGSDSSWGTGTDADSAVEYVDEALNFVVNKDFYVAWSTPDGEDYENVHIEVTALNNSSDPAAAFGIICNLQITDSRYYFAVTGTGTYAIGLSTIATDELLTNNNEWAESSLITAGAPSYRIGADCGSDGTLTLYVDGQKVDSVTDTTYTTGSVGLFGWSDEETNATDVSFDDFVMTKLE